MSIKTQSYLARTATERGVQLYTSKKRREMICTGGLIKVEAYKLYCVNCLESDLIAKELNHPEREIQSWIITENWQKDRLEFAAGITTPFSIVTGINAELADAETDRLAAQIRDLDEVIATLDVVDPEYARLMRMRDTAFDRFLKQTGLDARNRVSEGYAITSAKLQAENDAKLLDVEATTVSKPVKPVKLQPVD